MCFFTLHRYRVCQHDQIGPFVAFCTISKARASSDESNSTEPSPLDRHGAHGNSTDPISTIDDTTKPNYCGQPLFSPAYISEFGFDSVNCGICQNCNLEESIGNHARPVGNADSKIGLLESTQCSHHHNQLISTGATTGMAFQPHPLGSGVGSCLLSNPFLPKYSSLCTGELQCSPPPFFQRTIPTPFHGQPLPLKCLSPVLEPVMTTGDRNLEHPTNLSATLQQMLHKYPPRTRVAIEKAVANQPLEQRTQTLQTLRACFEEGIRQNCVARGAEPALIVAGAGSPDL